MKTILLFVVTCLYACASSETQPDPTPAAPEPSAAELMQMVQLRKADPPPSCVERGSLAEMIWMGDVEGARRNLRKKAWRLGANYVRLEMPASGTAYACPVAGTPPPVAEAAPAGAISPDQIPLMKADPPPSCVERGSVMQAIWFGDLDGARRALRQKAAALGANYVRLELPSSGTAYYCPPPR
jgi:hypothetical protein